MMELHQAARKYLGCAFKHQGRSREGMDCVGLVVMSLADCGRQVADVTSYGRDPHNGLLERNLSATFGPAISMDQMRPGDIVAIDFAGAVRHVAIIGVYEFGGLSLIHTDESVGRVVEHRLDSKWLSRIKGIFRP